MALTPEFIKAVSIRNLLRVRIMLKDSLLVDKNFNQFTEMQRYAEGRGVIFWMKKTEDLEIVPKAKWNMDLMNLELTRLVNDFTKERLVYCQSIIENVYGITPYQLQNHAPKPTTNSIRPTQQIDGYYQYSQSAMSKTVNANSDDYKNILKGALKINKILRDNKSTKGNRTWNYADIDEILAAAKKISVACENIKRRK